MTRRTRRKAWSAALHEIFSLAPLEERMLLTVATQVVFAVSPSTTAANSVMIPSVEVDIEDPTGAIATTNLTDTITLSFDLNGAPPGAQLKNGATGSFATTVSVKAVGGRAIFSSLIFNTAGSYYLRASDTSTAGAALNQATSNFFSITAPATQVVYTSQPSSVAAGSQFSISAQIEDATGALVSSDQSVGTISIQSGPGTLTGTATATAKNGVLTFNGLTLSKAGTYKLQIRDGSLPISASATLTVNSGNAAALSFVQQPTSTGVGAEITPPVVVDIVDSFGNVVTSANGPVSLTLASGPGGATIDGTTTVNAVNGVATFPGLSIAQQGTGYSFQASDGTHNATSNSFAVVGPAAQLVFKSVVPQTTAGHVITPGVVVLVEDSSGSVVTTDTSAVTIALGGSGSGTLSGTTTVNAVNGQATFSDLSISSLGTYVLSASDGSLTGTSSASFLINGQANQLVFTAEPSGGAAKSTLPAFRVAVEDTAGNTVLDYSGAITISLGTSPSGASLTGSTVLNAANGVATFSSLVLSRAGDYTLVASGAGVPNGATSTLFTVAPGPSQLQFTQGPGNVANGSTMPAIKVAVEDINGNVVTSNTSTVTLVVHGPGTVSGTTSVAAVAGIATFTGLSFAKSGAYSFVATDADLNTASSAKFHVTPPATRVRFSPQPAPNWTAGQAMTLTVRILDNWGNLVTTDTSTVTLAIASGPTGATIIGNATAAAVGGIVTFSGIELDKAGKYKFSITDGALTGMTSNAFTVHADLSTASTSNIQSQFSLASTSGSLVGLSVPTVTVRVTDRFGNVRTNYNGPVTLGINDNGSFGTFDPAVVHGKTTVRAVRGVAHFTNLRITTTGSYLLADEFALGAGTFDGVASGNALTITPVVTSLGTPTHAGAYQVGQPIKLTGTIRSLKASPSIGFAAGTVELIDAGTSQVLSGGTTAATLNGNGTYSIIETGLAPGTYTVRVAYNRDGADVNHTGGASPAFTFTVGGTVTTLKESVTRVNASQNFTLTATVAATAGATAPRIGTVDFVVDGSTILQPAGVVITNNVATFTFSGSQIATTGVHQITAVYNSGDTTNYFTSTSPALKLTRV